METSLDVTALSWRQSGPGLSKWLQKGIGRSKSMFLFIMQTQFVQINSDC